MVQSETDFYVTHLDEHEWPCNQEQRQLPALVAQGIAAFVAHDGIHHGETGAESAHEALDQHQSAYDARNGGCLDVNGERGLVAHAGFVALLLEHDNAHDKVEGANAQEACFGIRNARHQEGAECYKEG